MIQTRISGAAAAARSSQRRTWWTSQALKLPRAPSIVALALSGAVRYQAAKTPAATRTPPSAAINSPLRSRDTSIRGGAYTATAAARTASATCS
jgi:hypothetical protein